MRVLVTLSSDAKFSATKIGTKTVTGGNTTIFGGDQTYNVWGIRTEREIVDVVDPAWELGDVDLENATIKLIAKDKYFDECTIDESKITVYVNGIESTTILKDITSTPPTDVFDTVGGKETLVGKEYTLQLSNITPGVGGYTTFALARGTDEEGYTTFRPTNLTTDNLNNKAGFKYRDENGGNILIKIEAGTIKDRSGNTSKEQQFSIGMMDGSKVEVYDVEKIQDAAANTDTFVFNVTDRNYDPSDLIELNEITVWVDGEQVDSIQKTSLTNKPIKLDIDGETGKILGHQYTLVLSNIAETLKQTGKSYLEWSGTLEIRILASAVKDLNGNILDPDTTTISDFVDYIKPEFIYEAANTTIGDGNHGNTKKVTVVFDVVDKYFSNTDLATDTNANLITIKVDNDTVDGAVNVTKTLTKKNDIIINTQTNEVTYKATGYTLGTNERKIGERYELLVQGLEQLDENGISNGYTYSGPMSIAFQSGKVTDSSGNGNAATTITIGVDETDGIPQDTQDPNGEIVDVVDPVWELGDVDLDAGTIKLIAKDKYYATSSLDEDDITIYVNGNETAADSIAKPTTTEEQEANKDKIWKEITGPEEKIVDGKTVYEYTLTLSNITPAETGYTNFTPANLSELNNTAGFKYRNENGGDISIKIAAGAIKDQSGNTSREQSFEIGKIDATKPEVYDVQKIQAVVANTETFIFNVTDRNYDSSKLITTGEITVWVDGTQVTSIGKAFETGYPKPIKLDIDGEEGKTLGHQYKLVLSNIAETLKQEGKSYLEWSGTVEIRIAESAAKDLNGNTLNTETTTISDFVDYIKPVIEPVTVTNPKNTTNKTYTMSFNVIDKYLNTTNMVTENEITVYVDGEEASSIVKTLTSTEIKETFKKTIDGVVEATATEHVIGHTYTLVLSNFEQALKQDGKNFMEWSGTVKIEIAENAVKDTSNNTLAPEVAKRTVDGEHVDFIKPVIEKVSSTRDSTAKTETIIFNVMDKYLDTNDALLNSEIKVYVDDEEVAVDYTNSSGTGLDGTFSKVATFVMNKETKVTTTQSANYAVTDTEQVVGQQYQLVLSNFEQASRNAKDYKDWSGTVEIKVLEGAVKDTTGNVNDETKLTGDFVDFIKPDLKYTHQSTDINTGTKTYTMTFDVTDKYYTTGQLSLADLTIKMRTGQKDEGENAIIYDLKELATAGKINVGLNKTEDIKASSMKMTNTSKQIVTATDQVIGHTYTLTISNLEKLEIESGNTTADYSGVITVVVAGGKIQDGGPSGNGTNPNGNVTTAITSGVDIPGGTLPDDATPIDVVKPRWDKISSSAYAFNPSDEAKSIATITFKGTDTYFDAENSTLTESNIEVYVNGSKIEDEVAAGITKTLTSTNLTEERIKNSGLIETETEIETVTYGKQYTLTIEGWAQDANQVKIRIPAGILKDKVTHPDGTVTRNFSDEKYFMIYNCLELTSSETETTDGFLDGNGSNQTGIARQDIQQVIFTSSIDGATATGVQKAWDVSAQNDGSIKAWTSQTSAPYTVYIGSDDEIFANRNSSYLFAHLGYSANYTTTEVVTNLNSLNTNSVINMSYMFNNFGYRKLVTLNLGAFDTKNVTNMSGMFAGCGYTEMTSLNLGTEFDTSKVTNMSNMFNGCGQSKIATLDLGTNFNTSEVTNMRGMFQDFAKASTQMTTLNLGATGITFNTSKVEDMSNMFNGCGQTAMTTFCLGSNFNTSAVENMSGMFQDFATNSSTMTSLDLGDLFYTTSATNMDNMFNGCGTTAMTTLDLGPAFTQIAGTNTNFVTNCGATNAVIYAPEAIYQDANNFKLNTTSETAINYTRGTINPRYRTEWIKEGTVVTVDSSNIANSTIQITLRGRTLSVPEGESYVYTSNVTSILPTGTLTGTNADLIKVFIDGTELTGLTKVVGTATTATNASTGANDVLQIITLSGFEESERQSEKKFKEWSGNITIEPAKGTLKDMYGSQFNERGEFENILGNGNFADDIADTTSSTANANGKLFADFIKPEFTYEASNTTIGDGNHGNTKKVTIVFDVTDKYFSDTDLATDINADLITVKVDNTTVNTTVNVTKTLTKKNDIIINIQTNEVTYQATGYTVVGNERKIGERYELLVEGLEQLDENGISNGYTYSGPMSIAFPSGKVTDLSGNVNDGTTITIGVDDTDGNPQDTQDPNGEIVDVVDPVWELGDVDLEAGTIKLIAKDKYFDAANSNLTIDDITVYVNNSESTAITKTITGPVEKVTGQKYEYTLQLSNITPSEAGYTDFTPTNLSELNNTAGFKYKSENGGDISIRIATGPIKDQSGNTSREQMFEIGKIDATKPEVYDVQKIQAVVANTETFIFNVTDRNYDSSDLIELNEITLWIDNVQLDSLRNSASLTSKEIKATIDGTTKVLGHQYTLVIPNIAETLKQEGKSYLEWSGTVEIKIAENAAKDLSGNTLNTDTTTISDFVDYIKPVIEPVTVTNPINRTDKTYTMSFNVIDKYLDTTNMVTENEITVYVDGEEASSIVKTLTSTEIKETFKKTVDGVVETTATEHVIGHTYTLVLSNFEQALKQDGKNFMEWSGTVKIEIAQNAVKDTSNNTLATEVAKRTVNGEHVDFIKPVIEKVSSTIDSTAKTETIIFNVMDKYLNTSDALLDSEIKVYVDDEEVAVDYTNSSTTGLDGTFSKVATFVMNKETKVTTTQSANYAVTDTEQVVGQQYQLVLSNFEQASRNAKDYKDYSGTVKIEIVENAVKDTSNNTLATEVAKRTVDGDFVDFIKPDLEYIHGTSDIDHTSKTYTMTFDVTDKYYTSGQFTAQDIIDGNIEILMQNGQKDSNGNAIVYNLKNEPVAITLTPVAKYAPAGTKVTNTSGEIVTTTENSHQIGHTYTLKIEHLEKLEIKEGLTTADYSGIITVGIPADRIEDRTIDESSNKNIATTITSGVDIPGGTLPDDAVAVDVVDPIWTKVSASASAIDPENKESSTATITFKGTDTYFDQNTFTIDKLKVIVNGSEVTTGITKTLDSTTTLTEERIKNNGLTLAEVETVQYGVQYTVTIKGFAQNANQVKIRIPKGLLVDEHGNDSEEKDLIVYNVLKSAASENEATSAFLGEAVATTIYPEGVTEVTPIERKNIERVEFVNGIAGSKATGVQRVWDVSAQGDGSIIAWTSNATAPYTVYIGSDDEIFANQNSSYLFAYIGYGTNCTATETITNLNLLNVKSVTNMSGMFRCFGYRTMTSLMLPTTFDTSNVTDMTNMFYQCGNEEMTILDLGTNFNTSNVTDMQGMFNMCGQKNLTSLDLSSSTDATNTTQFNTINVENMLGMFTNCGYMSMTSLNLGNNFDTTNVTNMRYMFGYTGYTKMTSLDLGEKFYTSNVTNMYRMFIECGYTKMTSLNLGDKFNTSNVTNMNKMFDSCGYTAMTSLDLGDLFYTTSVTDMYKMFNGCGATTMTKLDLGPAFTKIPNGTITKQASDYESWEPDQVLEYNAHDDFITGCGKSNLVIYVAEKIYYDKTTFKLGQ